MKVCILKILLTMESLETGTPNVVKEFAFLDRHGVA
jgi:hypothetical protein